MVPGKKLNVLFTKWIYHDNLPHLEKSFPERGLTKCNKGFSISIGQTVVNRIDILSCPMEFFYLSGDRMCLRPFKLNGYTYLFQNQKSMSVSKGLDVFKLQVKRKPLKVLQISFGF